MADTSTYRKERSALDLQKAKRIRRRGSADACWQAFGRRADVCFCLCALLVLCDFSGDRQANHLSI